MKFNPVLLIITLIRFTSDNNPRPTFDKQLRDFAPLKKRLQEESGQPIIGPFRTEFNEMEVIQLVPVIINHLKANQFSETDRAILQKIFGCLFQLMTEESVRGHDEPINPVLHELLLALRHRSSQSDDNDVEHNTVKRISDRKSMKKNPLFFAENAIKKHNRDTMSPPQRMLKFAALLIHESIRLRRQLVRPAKTSLNADRIKRKSRIHKKQLSPDAGSNGVPVGNTGSTDTNDDPTLTMDFSKLNHEARRRLRRSSDDQSSDKDASDEVEMNLLRAMIPSEDDDDGVDDVKTSDITEDFPVQPPHADYMDYAFDMGDTESMNEDDQLLRSFYNPYDYDYASFSELMQLAAKHHSRAQRDEGYLKRMHGNDDGEDEDDY